VLFEASGVEIDRKEKREKGREARWGGGLFGNGKRGALNDNLISAKH